MGKVKLLISYDGTDFCGWQRQEPHKHAPPRPSIQQTLEEALFKVLREKINVSASGRTDAGVHALAQICHFETERTLPKDLPWALYSYLPSSIVVKAAWLAPEEFHSTLSADRKTYKYLIWNQTRPSAVLNRYTWWLRHPLRLDFLQETADFLVKKQDFKSFQSAGTPTKTSIREIYSARWQKKANGIVEFRITGNGFMKQMVRNIVGTQVQLDLKGKPAAEMEKIIAACDRRVAGMTAPAQGLFLEKVYYPTALDNKCRRI